MSKPTEINQRHWDELVAAAVSPEIASLNFWTVEDPAEVDRLLNRNSDRKWQHSADLVPGWAVAGVDPETGERNYLGVQYKPDNPRPQTDKEGKQKLNPDNSIRYRKYESASGYPAEPLTLDTGDGDYWKRLQSDHLIPLLTTEGAKKAASGLSRGYATISIPGVCTGQKLGKLKPRLEKFCGIGRTVYLCFDNDLMVNRNVCKALDTLGRLISACGAVVKVPLLPEGEAKGLDDFLATHNKEAFDLVLANALTFEEWRKTLQKPELKANQDPAVEFLQRACKALYSDKPWICFGNILYQWTGSYYKETADEVEYPRVREFCNNYEVLKEADGESFLTYPYAKPIYVKQILEWQKMSRPVTAEQVNPPGLNCTNGLLDLCWQGKTLVPKLIPHSQDKYYLSEPKVTYDPDADPSEYKRLIQCLDSVSRKIWEKTIAAALDLATVRKYKGRCVRALFLKGDGANGKDTLRGLVQELFGRGAIASCSVTDFSQYDSGTYFKVYPLRGKLINWPSENADAGRVDQLKGLRAAITGDPLTFEQKYRQGIQEPCKAVFLFNVNEAPTLVTTLKASESRWGIIPFNKTYSDNPAKGELQADPRFKEDPLFVQEKILPAFLNILLEQLQAVVLAGIDYSPTQELMEEIQRESSHLLQFAQDTGLCHDPDASVEVNELWQQLKQWYIDAGTLFVETTVLKDGKTTKEKYIWVDQVKHSDRNVKGANQIIPRFLELFPKAKKYHNRTESKRETGIKGLAFCKTEVVFPESGVNGVSGDRSTENQGFQKNGHTTSGVSQSQSGVSRTESDADASSRPDDATLTPAQIVEPSQNGHSGPNDVSDTSFETKNSAAFNNGYFKPGDRVSYIGLALSRVAAGKLLTVVFVGEDTAEVKADDWLVTQSVPVQDLRLVV